MLITTVRRERPQIRLGRVTETDSGLMWVMTFLDRKHKLMQTVILPKGHPAEAMETVWDELHEKWAQQLKETEWKACLEDFK
jgi:hypothetical protein